MFLYHLKEDVKLKSQSFIKKKKLQRKLFSSLWFLRTKRKRFLVIVRIFTVLGSPLSKPSGSAVSPLDGGHRTGGEPPSFPCPATRDQGGKSPKQNFCFQSPLAGCWVQGREQIGEGTKLTGLSSHWGLLTVDLILCAIVRLTTVLSLSLLLMRNQRIGSSVLRTSCVQELGTDTSHV